MAEYIRQGLHGVQVCPSQPSGGALELDAAGLPLFRRDAEVKGQPPALEAALQLEQDALLQEDRRRAGLPA